MKVSLTQSEPGTPIVHLVFLNDSSASAAVALPRAEVADGDYIQFEPRAPYLGIQVKRAPYGDDEKKTLSPGASFETRIDLSNFYDLSNIGSTARIRYVASHPISTGDDAMTEVASDWTDLQV